MKMHLLPICDFLYLSGCKEGRFGPSCKKHCQCENGGSCNVITGQCTCPAGWMGPLCNVKCPAGRYGENCNQSCACLNGGQCNDNTGRCECEAGYTGKLCQQGRLLHLIFTEV